MNYPPQPATFFATGRHIAALGGLLLTLAMPLMASDSANPALSSLGTSILFHASFDNESTDADLSPGTPTDTGQEKELNRFVDGVYGKAFFPKGRRSPLYSLRKTGLALGVPGAALIWVSPQEWQRDLPEEYVFFLRLGASDGQLLLAKSNQQGRTDRLYAFAKGAGDERGDSVSAGDTSHWQDDEWHLLAVNWATDWIAISVDGGPFTQLSVPKLASFGELEWISIGNGEVPGRRVAYDEVILLDRPLEQEEVEALFQAGGAR